MKPASISILALGPSQVGRSLFAHAPQDDARTGARKIADNSRKTALILALPIGYGVVGEADRTWAEVKPYMSVEVVSAS